MPRAAHIGAGLVATLLAGLALASCGEAVEPTTVELLGPWQLTADYETTDGGTLLRCQWRNVPLTIGPSAVAHYAYVASFGPEGDVRCRGADGAWVSRPGVGPDRRFGIVRTGAAVALYDGDGLELHGTIGSDGRMRGTLTFPPYAPDPFTPAVPVSGVWLAQPE